MRWLVERFYVFCVLRITELRFHVSLVFGSINSRLYALKYTSFIYSHKVTSAVVIILCTILYKSQ